MPWSVFPLDSRIFFGLFFETLKLPSCTKITSVRINPPHHAAISIIRTYQFADFMHRRPGPLPIWDAWGHSVNCHLRAEISLQRRFTGIPVRPQSPPAGAALAGRRSRAGPVAAPGVRGGRRWWPSRWRWSLRRGVVVVTNMGFQFTESDSISPPESIKANPWPLFTIHAVTPSVHVPATLMTIHALTLSVRASRAIRQGWRSVRRTRGRNQFWSIWQIWPLVYQRAKRQGKHCRPTVRILSLAVCRRG